MLSLLKLFRFLSAPGCTVLHRCFPVSFALSLVPASPVILSFPLIVIFLAVIPPPWRPCACFFSLIFYVLLMFRFSRSTPLKRRYYEIVSPSWSAQPQTISRLALVPLFRRSRALAPSRTLLLSVPDPFFLERAFAQFHLSVSPPGIVSRMTGSLPRSHFTHLWRGQPLTPTHFQIFFPNRLGGSSFSLLINCNNYVSQSPALGVFLSTRP